MLAGEAICQFDSIHLSLLIHLLGFALYRGLGKTVQTIALLLANRGRGPTLIVCPVSVISNWQEQIETHVAPDTLQVGVYHGPQRHELDLKALDVVIASYGTTKSDFGSSPNAKKTKKRKRTTTIFEQYFFRVVLDEAHTIRNTNSQTFRACMALKAQHRWGLTGTPLPNKPQDVQALLQFVRLEPWADTSVFRRAIAQPLRGGDEQGLQLLRKTLQHIALRRSKSTIVLPEKQVQLVTIEAAPEDDHQRVYQCCTSCMSVRWC